MSNQIEHDGAAAAPNSMVSSHSRLDGNSNELMANATINASVRGATQKNDNSDQIPEPKTLEEVLTEQNEKINFLQNSIGMLINSKKSDPDMHSMFDYDPDNPCNVNIDSSQKLLDDVYTFGNEEEDQLDPSVKSLLEELDQQNEFGPRIEKVTAQAYNAVLSYQVSKEASDKWKSEYKTPENCTNLVVPMVNTEIWNCLPMSAKTSDARYQAMQQQLVRSLVAQTKTMDLIMLNTAKSVQPLILRPLLDSAKLISLTIQEMNQKRKMNLRNFMRPEYRSLCTSKLHTGKFLFGDNLEVNLKSVRATSNIVRPMNTSSEQYKRFHPYRQHTRGHLNFQRPPQSQHNRGGANFRNQRSMYPRGQGRWMPKFRQ